MNKKVHKEKSDNSAKPFPAPFLTYPRCAGVLLHITSLPSRFGVGDLGPQAYVFADFLQRSHQTIWQILPLNSTSSAQGFSPYGSDGSFAGNWLLISPELLLKEGWLTHEDLEEVQLTTSKFTDYSKATTIKTALLAKAYSKFKEHRALQQSFETFCKKEKAWLDDYALYIVLKSENENRSWNEWEDAYKKRDATALEAFTSKHLIGIEKIKWQQFVFHQQWHQLKTYCNGKGVKILGDLPFYIGYDSADVWVNQHLFKLEATGKMIAEGGAPPDDFNAEGQRWGMPVYNWEAVQKENYAWWLSRMKKNIALFDLLRLDHFRGFSAYWEIKTGAKSAKEGEWKRSPGETFFRLLKEETGSLPFVAEDLGSIDEEVIKLREQFSIPGMIIQQVAFGSDMPQSKSILHHHYKNAVVYTGNHDNNTTLGWFKSLSSEVKKNVSLYTNRAITKGNVCEELSRLVYVSVAKLAILPMQDLLHLDEYTRMNSVPDDGASWSWQMPDNSLTSKVEKQLQNLCYLYDRKPKQIK